MEKVDTNSDGIDGDLTVERAQLGTTVAVQYHGALVHKVLPITGAQRCTAWEWDGTGCAQWSTIGMCPGGAWVRESGVVTASLDDSVDAGVALRFSFDLQNPSDAQESPEVSVRISGMQFDNDDGAASRLTSHVLAKDGVSIPGFAGARAMVRPRAWLSETAPREKSTATRLFFWPPCLLATSCALKVCHRTCATW